MLEKFFPVVADNGHDHAVGEAEGFEAREEPAHLGVHSPDRPVIPGFAIRQERRDVDFGGVEVGLTRHHLSTQKWTVDLLPDLGDPLGVRGPLGRVGPHRVVRGPWFEGAVRVEQVQEHEERHVAMDVEPWQ